VLVIDASALVEVLTADPDEISELAQRIHDAEWMSAPDLIDYEVLNVLRRLVVSGDIDGELAEDARRTLRDLRLTRYPLTDEMSDRVWQLRHNASAYDASYVALAEHLDLPVVTADGRLARGLQSSTSAEIETYAVEIDRS
jgi:predicted nucleic acid-binding protein